MLTWIVDKYVDRVRGAPTPFIDEAMKRGHIVHALRDSILPKEIDLTGIVLSGPTIVRGSHGFVNYVEKELAPVPGGFTHPTHFQLETYAPILGTRCLNASFKKMTYQEFCDNRTEFGSVFVKPHGDLKRFTGIVVHVGHTLEQTYLQKFGRWFPVDPACELIVAPVVAIGTEHRVVVVDGKPISGSTYDITDHSSLPDGVMDMALEVASIWNPAPVYVVDIGSTPSGYKVVEYNQFSTAAMYNCDQTKIIDALEEMVENT